MANELKKTGLSPRELFDLFGLGIEGWKRGDEIEVQKDEPKGNVQKEGGKGGRHVVPVPSQKTLWPFITTPKQPLPPAPASEGGKGGRRLAIPHPPVFEPQTQGGKGGRHPVPTPEQMSPPIPFYGGRNPFHVLEPQALLGPLFLTGFKLGMTPNGQKLLTGLMNSSMKGSPASDLAQRKRD